MSADSVLSKKNWRSDAFWMRPRVFKSPLKLVPLFADTRALMRSQYWPRERMQAYQDRRIESLLQDSQKLPFWRRVIARAGQGSARERLSRLPVTAKSELSKHERSEIIDESLLSVSDPDHTSGSTGKPFHFFHDWGSSLRSYAVTERVFRTAAGGRRYPIVYVRSRERNGFTFWRHHWFFARGFNALRHRVDEFAALRYRYPRGFILYGYSSWVLELAHLMEERGISLPIKVVMVAGEHISAQDKQYIARVMGAEVFELYASREVGFIGYECEHHKMHVSEEWAAVEIVDERGTALPAGEQGRVVVTTFDNRVMPFIRYELGDVGIIAKEPCVCGRTLPTLTFRGRTSEIIELEGGRHVTLLDIAYAIGTYRDTITQYQIVQTGGLSFVFRVVPGPAFEAGKDYLEQLMIRLLHPRARIEWEIVERIEEAASGKAQYFLRDFRA